jgi:dienelactone hydrolase
MRSRLASALVVIALLVTGCGDDDAATPATTTTSTTALVPATAGDAIQLSTTTAPAGFDVEGAHWIEIARTDGGTQIAAAFVPDGAGPFPVVVLLHGVSGLKLDQLQLASRIADAGYLVVAGCYLDADPEARNPSRFMRCPGLPPHDQYDVPTVTHGYGALVDVAQALGAAREGPIGIVGISFGGYVALDAVDPSVGALVVDSSLGTFDVASDRAPVLFLGAEDDPVVPHDDVLRYEQVARDRGREVESHYYAVSGHVVTTIAETADDATRRAIAFLDDHLR